MLHPGPALAGGFVGRAANMKHSQEMFVLDSRRSTSVYREALANPEVKLELVEADLHSTFGMAFLMLWSLAASFAAWDSALPIRLFFLLMLLLGFVRLVDSLRVRHRLQVFSGELELERRGLLFSERTRVELRASDKLRFETNPSSVALATPAGGKQDLAYGLSQESAAQLIAFVEQQRNEEAAALRAAEQRQSL